MTYTKFMRLLNNFSEIHDATFGVWILEDYSTNILFTEINIKYIDNFNLYAKRQGSCLDTPNSLRVKFVRQNEAFPFVVSEILKQFLA